MQSDLDLTSQSKETVSNRWSWWVVSYSFFFFFFSPLAESIEAQGRRGPACHRVWTCDCPTCVISGVFRENAHSSRVLQKKRLLLPISARSYLGKFTPIGVERSRHRVLGTSIQTKLRSGVIHVDPLRITPSSSLSGPPDLSTCIFTSRVLGRHMPQRHVTSHATEACDVTCLTCHMTSLRKWSVLFYFIFCFFFLLESRLQSHIFAVNCGVFWWWD